MIMVYKDVDPVKQMTVLDVQWSNIPEDVYEEVKRFWIDRELGNDFYYAHWGADDFYTTDDPKGEFKEEYKYPQIAAYLRSRGIEECLIHYWW